MAQRTITRVASQPVQQPSATQTVVDPRPAVGATWVDENGLTWYVRERKSDGARFWAAGDKSGRTSHIGTLEEALKEENK